MNRRFGNFLAITPSKSFHGVAARELGVAIY
jgi:hypothetical protein